MPTYIRIAEPKPIRIVEPRAFLRGSMLGVPLAIWAIALLVIAFAARYDVPLGTFDPQDLLAPF